MARGLLIAFEGIDGAGKTTQARMVKAALEQSGLPVLLTKEPTDGPWGRKLRSSANTGRLAPAEELEAFIEDRREHVRDELLPALAAGTVVLVDRYYFSTAAYQGIRGYEAAELLTQNEAFAPQPDLLVVLDVDPAAAVDRIRRRDGRENAFERVDLLSQVRAEFLAMRRPYLRVVDASLDVEALHAAVAAEVDQVLFAKRCQRSDLTTCEPVHCPFHAACGYRDITPDPLHQPAVELMALATALAADPTLTQDERIRRIRAARP